MEIKFIPEDTLQKLEFDKIQQYIIQFCISEEAKQSIVAAKFFTNITTIQKKLDEVNDTKELIEQSEDLPLQHFEDISNELFLLSKDGYVLDIEEIQRLNAIIQNTYYLILHIKKARRQKFKAITDLASEIEVPTNLLGMVDLVLDDKGEVKENASPELSRVSRSIRSKMSEVDRKFNELSRKYKKLKFLTETEESYRFGRRVLSVPAENKRKIKGIIHDESATGKTSFIEPEEVVFLNNELTELELDRKKEIYKILKDLCNKLRPFSKQLNEYFSFLLTIDVIRAKARFAIILNARKPIIKDGSTLQLKGAYHPLLLLKNLKAESPTVAFDMILKSPNRIVLISGPNAGGKSITLKAVGLIQLMVQTGCLVPIDENSVVGVFHKVLCDIGDQQSLEEDLSTYSSRLKNMTQFIEEVDENCLLLIDEFGSGTDPKIGGAIAEAILKELNTKHCYGVITTHYSNLKIFTYKTRGIVNAAMLFDRENLKPNYILRIGRPGSSFAYEIAEKAGLNQSVLHYAKKRTGKNTQAVDQLLNDLQSEKKESEELISRLELKEQQLDKLMKNYEQLSKELEYKRKKHRLERKKIEIQQKEEIRKELDKLVKEIKDQKDLEKAKLKLQETHEKKKNLEKSVSKLTQDVYYSKKYTLEDFKIGDYVRLRTGTMTGVIEKIHKSKANLLVGQMQMTVPLNELVPAKAPLTVNPRKRITTSFASNHEQFGSKLDIRGYRKEEAIKMLEEFMNSALITDKSRLEILHGKGNGILRKLVHSKIKEYKNIKSFYHPEDEFGGEGITVLTLQ